MQITGKHISIIILAAITMMVTACGTSNTTDSNTVLETGSIGNSTSARNMPYPNFPPSSQPLKEFASINVVNSQGQHVTLNANRHPVLFMAYWCPHCRREIATMVKAGIPDSKMPYLVSTGFQSGDTIKSVILKTNEDLKKAGAKSGEFQIYYLPSDGSPYVSEFPIYVYRKDNQKLTLYAGENDSPIFWKKITSVNLVK